MDKMGSNILDEWDKFDARLDLLRDGEAVVIGYVGDVGDVAIVPKINGRARPFLALETFCREREKARARPIIASITRSNSGLGWTLWKRDDTKDLDLSRLTKIPGICFTHPNGFVAKTHEMDAPQALTLLRKALAKSEESSADATDLAQEEEASYAADRANP